MFRTSLYSRVASSSFVEFKECFIIVYVTYREMERWRKWRMQPDKPGLKEVAFGTGTPSNYSTHSLADTLE